MRIGSIPFVFATLFAMKVAGDDNGECNGTSCQLPGFLGFPANYPCDFGSCVGTGGGDGARCMYEEASKAVFCPVGCRENLGNQCPL
ncbi:hypothetical protein F4779DRAFT_624020 [Xylariaceae sp. FL0662B]|nr:hypothetical protein F4779DRAFT_624020 [Xylariaceae sp. FL0662B]